MRFQAGLSEPAASQETQKDTQTPWIPTENPDTLDSRVRARYEPHIAGRPGESQLRLFSVLETAGVARCPRIDRHVLAHVYPRVAPRDAASVLRQVAGVEDHSPNGAAGSS